MTLRSKHPCTANSRVRLTAFLLSLSAILFLPGQSFAENSEAAKVQTQAYVSLVYADEAMDSEKWQEAESHYTKALQGYRQIQSKHPNFNPEIISYRIAYCQNKLNTVERNSRLVQEPTPETDLYESRYNAAREENAYLRSLLQTLEEEREDIHDASDPGILMNEISRLNRELVKIKSGKPDTDTALLEDIQEARNEASQLRNEVNRQQALLDELRPNGPVPESGTPQGRAALNEMQTKLQNEQNINRQLLAQITELDQQVQDLTETNREQSGELVQFGQQIATLLGREQEAAIALTAKKEELAALRLQREDGKAQPWPDPPGSARKNSEKTASLEQEIRELSSELQTALEARATDQATAAENTAELDRELKALASRNAEIQAERVKTEEALSAKLRELEQQLETHQREEQRLREALDTAEREKTEALSDPKSLQGQNRFRREDAVKVVENIRTAMKQVIADRTRLLQDEVDRLLEEVAELKSYQESVEFITPPQLAKLREQRAAQEERPLPAAPLETIPEDETSSLKTLLYEGQEQEREGNLEEARDFYSQILEETPGQADATKGLSRIFLHKGEPKQALTLLNEILKKNPYESESLLLLGLGQYAMEDYGDATRTLHTLVQHHPDNSQGWNALGASFMAQEKSREARESFEQAIVLDAGMSDAHYNLAQILRIYFPEEKSLTRKHYQTAIDLGSNQDPDLEAFLQAP